ncbi:Guanylate cyclase 32E [Cyphomyrmex costatus]|uniref:Guanylate cyclase 32E n=1 Tax=Cyphomyrmex costatus TaxID=456900 RepID=A0A151IKF1_9HYME|nr:Guanylate cyclase 32E [Cyphomyrmex costatus]
MHSGPLVQPSYRRPLRRQYLHQLHEPQLHRECNQQQQQQERCLSHLLPRSRGHGSRALLVLLLLVSSALVLTQAETPEPSAAPTTECMRTSTISPNRNLWSRNNDTAIQPVNLTIGYLPAIKGGLKDRQGLAISGAITIALNEINNDPNILPNVKLVMRWSDTRGETIEATRAMLDMICDGVVAFFGPEGTCFVEATVSESRNIPMMSYKKYCESQLEQFAQDENKFIISSIARVLVLVFNEWHTTRTRSIQPVTKMPHEYRRENGKNHTNTGCLHPRRRHAANHAAR